MNIFALDPCPLRSARLLCDKHVVKMPLETAQILCTVLDGYNIPATYRPTHRAHPCTKWAAESKANFNWLAMHGWALCIEYKVRYGKLHKSFDVIMECLYKGEAVPFGISEMTPFALAMPDGYKTDCVHESYKNYYLGAKAHLLKYTNRTNPFETI